MSDWVKQWDPHEEAHYYYNEVTNEAVWDEPEGFSEGGKSETMDAAVKLQTLFRGKKAREEVEQKKKELDMSEGKESVWIKQWDPSEEAYYYYNTETEACQWEEPPGFAPGGKDEKVEAVLKMQGLFRAKAAREKVDKVRKATQDADGGKEEAKGGTEEDLGGKDEEAPAGKEAEAEGDGKAAEAKAQPETLAEKLESKQYGELSYVESEAIKGDWVKQWDPVAGAHYFWNSRTGESSWDEPEGFVEGGESQHMAAALKIQSAFRGNKARAKVEAKRKELKMTEGDAAVGAWVKQWDPTEAAYYYWNSETDACQWEEPEGYVDGATNETVTAVLKIQCMFRTKMARRKVAQARDRAGGTDVVADEGKVEADRGGEEAAEHRAELSKAAQSKAFGELSYLETGEVEAKWIEQWDPQEKGYYYWNTKTGEAVWEKPDDFQVGEESQAMAAALKIQSAFRGNRTRKSVAERVATLKLSGEAGGVWVKQWDPTEKANYYYNTGSYECTWDEPAGFVEGATDETVTAVLTIQCMFRNKLARRRVREVRLESSRLTGAIVVNVLRAQLAKPMDYKGRLDTYVVIWIEEATTGGPGERKPRGPSKAEEHFGVTTAHTSTRERGGRNPSWPEGTHHELAVELDNDIVLVEYEKRKVMWVEAWNDEPGEGPGELLGQGRVDLEEVVRHHEAMPVSVRLLDVKGDKVEGTVHMTVCIDEVAAEFIPLAPNPDAYMYASGQGAGAGAAEEEDDPDLDGLFDALATAERVEAEQAAKHPSRKKKKKKKKRKSTDAYTGYFEGAEPEPEPEPEASKEQAEDDGLLQALRAVDGGVAAQLAAEEAAEADAESAEESDPDEEAKQMRRLHSSATKIQAAYRGHFHRENLKLIANTPQVQKRKRKVRRRLARTAKKEADLAPLRRRIEVVEGQYIKLSNDEAAEAAEIRKKLDAAGESVVRGADLVAAADRTMFAIKHKQVTPAIEAARVGVEEAERDLLTASKVAINGLEPVLLRAITALLVVRASDVYKEAVRHCKRRRGQRSRIANNDAVAIKKGVDAATKGVTNLLDVDPTESKEAAVRSAVVKALRHQTNFFDARVIVDRIQKHVADGAAAVELVLRERERAHMRLEEAHMHAHIREMERRRIAKIDRASFVAMCLRRYRLGRKLRKQMGDDDAVDVATSTHAGTAMRATRRVEMAAFRGGVAQTKRDKTFKTPYQACAGGATVARLRTLLTEAESRLRVQEGRQMNINDPDTESRLRLLHAAAWNGHKHLVSFLVRVGAEVNQVDNTVTRQTALHYAARAGHAGVIAELLAEGASAAAQDSGGDTPLHWAARRGHYKALRALLPQDLLELEEELDVEVLTQFAGEPEDMPPMWQAITLRNHRQACAKDVAATAPLARILTEADYAVQARRRTALPLRSALDVGRSVPPGQAPAALGRPPSSGSFGRRGLRSAGSDSYADLDSPRGGGPVDVAGRRAAELKARKTKKKMATALATSASSRSLGRGAGAGAGTLSKSRSAASLGQKWVIKTRRGRG